MYSYNVQQRVCTEGDKVQNPKMNPQPVHDNNQNKELHLTRP
jgi:hypothetical protein